MDPMGFITATNFEILGLLTGTSFPNQKKKHRAPYPSDSQRSPPNCDHWLVPSPVVIPWNFGAPSFVRTTEVLGPNEVF